MAKVLSKAKAAQKATRKAALSKAKAQAEPKAAKAKAKAKEPERPSEVVMPRAKPRPLTVDRILTRATARHSGAIPI